MLFLNRLKYRRPVITNQGLKGLGPSVYSSLAMAFAGMGDAFLYPFLPLYSKEIGIPGVWVGVLLSINRFVRIFLSPVIMVIFRNFNSRQVITTACFVAICCTIGYGLNAGLIGWILFRSIWGVCFSALRISVASFALHHQRKGFALGLSNGMYEIGPLIALSMGPLIMFYVGIEHTFYVLALLSSVALYFSYKIPTDDSVITVKNSTSIQKLSSVNVLTFVAAFIAEGLIIILMTIIIQRHYSIPTVEAATISSGLLVLRRICTLIASPVGGIIVDRFGSQKMLLASVLSLSTGVVLLSLNFIFAGLVLIFISHPVSNAILILIAATRENQDSAIIHQTVSKDAGAAAGLVITFIKPSKVT